MGIKDNSEIEQIQRGLEAFLEKELKQDGNLEGQGSRENGAEEDFLEEYQRIGGLCLEEEGRRAGRSCRRDSLQVIGQGRERFPEGVRSRGTRREMPSRPGGGRPGGAKDSQRTGRVPGRSVYPGSVPGEVRYPEEGWRSGKGRGPQEEWYPGEGDPGEEWYPGEGDYRKEWYPGERESGEEWYSGEDSGEEWYPGEGDSGEGWYSGEDSGEEWYPGEGESGEGWYPGEDSGEEWYPGEEYSRREGNSQEEQWRSGGKVRSREKVPASGNSPFGGKVRSQEKVPAGGNSPSGGKVRLKEKIPAEGNNPSGGKARSKEKIPAEGNSPSGKKRRAQESSPSAENSAVLKKGQDQGIGHTEQEESQMPKKTSKSHKSSKKKPRRKKSLLLRLLIACCVIAALLGFGLYHLVGSVYGKMSFQEIEAVAAQPMEEDGVVNILLIGNDSRSNGNDGRSDAMILLSISSRTKTIYMTSILRDIYVDIPGREGNRLNAAYSFGGPELLMETIEKNFDISVNRYVSVNFEAFANLIDAVGGVDLELSSKEIEYVNGYLVEYNMLTGREQGTDNMDPAASGLVHLNGPQALAYSRNRYIGTDFGRTERQRKVLMAAVDKIPSALLNDAEGLMDKVLPNLTTNLTQNECFQLSLMAGKLLTYEIVSDSIPQPGTYQDATIRKMAVLQVDFEANIKYLKEKIYGETEEE